MHIVQIASRIAPGTGIAGVAWNLEREFALLGHTVERFTDEQALGRRPRARSRLGHLLRQAGDTVQLSFRGTRRARRFLSERPGAVSITHNAVGVGNLFVDHIVMLAAVAARGGAAWRVLRNPTLAFGWVRDSIRFRSGAGRLIVAPSEAEAGVLRRVYRHARPRVMVIPNGVDLEAFRPPDAAERMSARAALGLDDQHRVALFVGHELRWKGVPLLIDALASATTVMLLVVGGDATTIAAMRSRAEKRGVSDRVHFAGPRADLLGLYHAADMFVLPSAYESYGLVVTEALASGVPVVATRVGAAPDLIAEGRNGYLVDADPLQIAERLEMIAATDVDEWRSACRDSVSHLTWRAAAERYVRLLSELEAIPDRAAA